MQQPLYNPTFINLEYFFSKLANGITAVIDFFKHTNAFFIFQLLIGIVILFSVAIIIYSCIRIFELLEVEEEELKHELIHAQAHKEQLEAPTAIPRNLKWESARDKVFTDNPSDWKLAIIEADVVLDDFLTERGYNGAGVGEKLKDAEVRGDLKSLQDAWDAHKTRNEIAHEGGGYDVSKRDAIRTIGLFEKVFEEEGYI